MARRIGRQLVDKGLSRLGYALVADDDGWYHTLVDQRVPLPAEAAELTEDNTRLQELRAAYDRLDWPVCEHSRWQPRRVARSLDLRYFRGDNSFLWHYREAPRVSMLKYFVYLTEVRGRDEHGLVARLGEDGAFGCWTYHFDGYPPCSRDLLDAVSELLFLDRHLGVLHSRDLRVLDVGAGYGRLAHRFVQAVPSVADYCCADAVAVSTFLCEWYTRYRQVSPPARVVPLPDVPDLEPGSFDLVCNVHSWSECTLGAIRWWIDQVARLEVPRLFVVPNEDEFLSLEVDGTRRDYLPHLEAAGYRLLTDEPAVPDAAIRELLDMHDRYCLLERAG